jgi:hypothetical protein
MLNVIHVEWNNVWTFDQIKWAENRFEILSRLIRKREYELDDISNFDDATIYFHDAEASRNIRQYICGAQHVRYTTSDDQNNMYSTLFVQSSYAYSVVRFQSKYSYHHESQSFSSIVFVVLSRTSESVD